jgi:hypothetical protein
MPDGFKGELAVLGPFLIGRQNQAGETHYWRRTVSVGSRGLHAGVTAREQRYVSAGLAGTRLSVRQYSPVNSSPKLSFWPLAIAAAILALLLAVAVR